MTDDLFPVLLDDRVERVDGLRVDVVQPRGEGPVAPQLATMLVRDHIVGIVGPRAVESETADGPPLERLAGDDPVRSIGLAVRSAQQQPDIRFLEATPVAARRCDAGLVVDRQFLGPQRRQVRLRHVIAQPPEEPGDEDLRAGRHGRIAWRVELDEPDLPCGIAHGEPRHHAIVLGRNHRPAARRRAGAGPRPLDEFVDRDGYGPQPVREPRRVRHFIDRVEVLRADVRRLVAGPREQVLERVVLQIDLPLAARPTRPLRRRSA